MDIDYIKKLCEEGGDVYVVGNIVRNYLFSCIHKSIYPIANCDYLVCNLSQEKIIDILKQFGQTKKIGKMRDVIAFDPFNSLTDCKFTFQSVKICEGKHQDILLEYFSQKDATINAIGFKIKSIVDLSLLDYELHQQFDLTKFYDPFGAIEDITNKIWRVVGNPRDRFVEDLAMIIRAFRQSCELDLEIEKNTLLTIANSYDIIQLFMPDANVRLFDELLRLIKNNKSGKFVSMLHKLSILKILGFNDDYFDQEKIDLADSMIVKFALMLKPELCECQIEQWIHDRQLFATYNFTKRDLHVLVAIQSYSVNIKQLCDAECCVQMLCIKLLNIRKEIYEYARTNSNYVITQVLQYCKLRYELNIGVDFLSKELEQFIISTNQLAVNGNILKERWNLQRAQIRKIKNMILNEIFCGKLQNSPDQIANYIDQHYLLI